MKKTLLSALGLAVALAFAVPALGTTEANAATTMAKPATTKIVHHKKHKKHHAKKHHVVKRTHKKHGMKHAA